MVKTKIPKSYEEEETRIIPKGKPLSYEEELAELRRRTASLPELKIESPPK
jgi:hypothetical protein